MKIKKIVIVIKVLTGGGAERVVSRLSSSLADMGYEVSLLLLSKADNEYFVSNKVKKYYLSGYHSSDSKFKKHMIVIKEIRKKLKEINPEIVIPFLPIQTIETYIATRFMKIKFVSTIRIDPNVKTKNKIVTKLRDFIYASSDAIYLQTKKQGEYFSKNVRKKCFVVANPTDEEIINSKYDYSEKCENFIAIGRLEKQKNYPMLINVFETLIKENNQIKLKIYGQGNLENNIRELIKEKKLQNNIFLCGRTNDIVSVLKESDMFIMCSNFEGMPNALMEAMGVGLPCVSTNCPTGPKELIGDNERGYLVEINNEKEMEKVIKKLIDNKSERIKIGSNAKKYIQKNYSPQYIANELIRNIENKCFK